MRGGCCCSEGGQLLLVQTHFSLLFSGNLQYFACFWPSHFCLQIGSLSLTLLGDQQIYKCHAVGHCLSIKSNDSGQNHSDSIGGSSFPPSLSPPHQRQTQMKGQCVKARSPHWVMLLCHFPPGTGQLPIDISLPSSELVSQVPRSTGDLCLCLNNDASCPSNLLADASLEANEGVTEKEGGLQRVNRELAVTSLQQGFLIYSSGRLPERGCHQVCNRNTTFQGLWATWVFSGTNNIP